MSTDRFTVPTDIAGVVGRMMHEDAALLAEVATGMMQNYAAAGVPEENTPHLVIRNLIIAAATIGFVSLILEGRKPLRDRWTSACNETFDEVAAAFAAANGDVQ